MTGYLLDTNAALLALAAPDSLSGGARKAILGGPNILSAVVYWEVVLKCMKGALDVGDPRSWWQQALEELAAVPLSLRPEHVSGVYSLPAFHKDTFDRVLVAQATVESVTLITTDSEIPRYASGRFRVLKG